MNEAAIIDFDAKVGALVRRYRLLRNISQAKLGKQVGVSFQQIQKYERGQNRISVGILNSIREFLGIPLEEIFESDFEPLISDQTSLKILNRFSAVKDPKARKAILSLIDSMLENENG